MKRLFSLLLMLYMVLGSWKGHIALFREDEKEPWQIFPNKVEFLPQADQQALEEGIVVRNQRDLNQLLEDYLS